MSAKKLWETEHLAITSYGYGEIVYLTGKG